MSVFKLQDGRWVAQHREGKSKKRKYFTRGPEGEQAARDHDSRVKAAKATEKRRGGRLKPRGCFFIDLVDAYTTAKKSRNTQSTRETFYYKMDRVILPRLGHMRAMALTPVRLDKYVNERMAVVKATTVHRELSNIRAVLRWGVVRRLISHNPAEGFEMPRRDDERIDPPRDYEVAGILQHAPDRLKRAVTLSYYTGLRPGAAELFSMKWENVNLEAGNILVVSAQKGGRKERLVPVHPDFAITLRRWYLADGGRGYIVNYRGQPVRSLKKSFATAKRRAGITRRLRMYDLRHAFATLLLKHGADLKSTSELLGHSRPSTTLTVYQHTDYAMHQAAVAKLPGLIPQEKPLVPHTEGGAKIAELKRVKTES